jgi:3-isopropylmalate dehydratase small subunit
VNQGLPLIVLPEAVNFFKKNNTVELNLEEGWLKIEEKVFKFNPLPEKLTEILKAGGLVNWMLDN